MDHACTMCGPCMGRKIKERWEVVKSDFIFVKQEIKDRIKKRRVAEHQFYLHQCENDKSEPLATTGQSWWTIY